MQLYLTERRVNVANVAELMIANFSCPARTLVASLMMIILLDPGEGCKSHTFSQHSIQPSYILQTSKLQVALATGHCGDLMMHYTL